MPQMESMVLPPRLPLVVTTANRGRTFTKDSRLVNCYLETDKQGELWVYKRPGFAQNSTSTPGEAMGAFHWREDVYWIWDGTIYRNGVSIPGTIDITNGTYRFSSILGFTPKMVFGNGKKTYTFGEIPIVLSSVTTSAVGGTLGAGTYYYVVTAIVPSGETKKSIEMSVVTTGATSSNTINWQAVSGATSYRVYRGIGAGLENTFYTVPPPVLPATPSFVDTGAAGTAGTPPASGPAVLSQDLHTIDPDFPIEVVKGIVYLDGATYVMDVQGQIWGSKINSVDQPGDWTALNFIAAQSEPDAGVYLAKQFVYVIAMGQWSTEVFFNAGNETGSPLARVDGSKLSFGCACAESVQEIDDRLFWISSTKSAAAQVSSLDQLNHSIVSTDAIDRLIQSSNLIDANVRSTQLKIDGHSFYILTLKDVNLTLVYDINEDEWHQWTDENGNYFKMIAYTYSAPPKKHILQHESNGNTYLADPSYKNDFGSPIVVDIYAPAFDAQTKRRKQMNIMSFVGDQEVGSILQVRCSDDDFRTWSNFRRVDLNHHDPMLINEGTFTRRAYHFRHASNTALRMQAVEVQYDLGTL
jgi:hypothetical protein